MSSELNAAPHSALVNPSEQQQQHHESDVSSLVDEHTDKKRKFGGDQSAPTGGAASGSSAAGSADMSEDAVRKMVNSFNYEALAQLTTLICARNADAFELLHEQYARGGHCSIDIVHHILTSSTPMSIGFASIFPTAGRAT
jgi:hypothetical protein